jgi:carbon-monoxide dehydrogenase medium subunit
MKAPDFDYIKVESVDEALALLQEYGDDARILAGGQTLLATLNMRLSSPALLIDITGIGELRGIELRSGRLHIGALTTHSAVAASPLVAEHAPLLCAAAPHIAHTAIRNAGTWGGSIAFGDPAAEWPCCLVALDGVVVVQGPRGQRRVPAGDFFQDLYTTDLKADEIVVGADVAAATPADWFGFDELSRRHGDYAVAGVAVAARLSGAQVQSLRLAFLGMGNTPVRAPRTEQSLVGHVLDQQAIDKAEALLRGELDPSADLTHGPAAKRQLAVVLARRLLIAASASRRALSA